MYYCTPCTNRDNDDEVSRSPDAAHDLPVMHETLVEGLRPDTESGLERQDALT